MTKQNLKLNIGELWSKPNGTVRHHDYTNPAPITNLEYNLTFTFQLTLIKLKEGISAIIDNFHGQTTLECTKCLDQFNYSINFSEISALFLYEVDPITFIPLENFQIEKKDLSINLNDFLRQEITLQFPLIPLCSESCKGLCQGCGQNLNKLKPTKQNLHNCTNPKAQNQEPEAHKPLSILKELYNQTNN